MRKVPKAAAKGGQTVIWIGLSVIRSLTMEYHYKTKGTCSRRIDVELEDGRIKTVKISRRLQRKFTGNYSSDSGSARPGDHPEV